MAINTSLNLPNSMSNIGQNAVKSEFQPMPDKVQAVDFKDKKQIGKDEATNITEQMNKFMQLVNSDIQFEMHEGTKQLMVRMVDSTDGTVLKEFPPHELLDTMARIREYVGLLLDKKA